MIEKLLETFSKMYKRDGDSLILDYYKLGDGVYVLVNLNTGKVLTEFEVNKNNKCEDNKYYQNIVKYFNYSEIIGMNKAVDTKFKKIHSNQIYALKIKSNNLTKEIFEKNLDYYHKKLENYRDDLTKDKIKLKLYDELDDETKEVDTESLSKIKNWIEKNIYGYYEEKAKTINIYFVKTNLETEEEVEESYRDFERNMTKYLRPNVFVRTDCCIIDEESGKVLGVPNTWYTTNVDKGKINELPILLNAEEVILRDKLKSFLLKEMKKRNNFIYFNSFDIYATNKMIENKLYTNLIQIDRDSNGSVTFTRIEYLNNNEFSFEMSDIVDFTKNEKMADDYFVGVANLEKTKELFNKNIFNNRLDGYFSGMKIERDSLKNFTMKYKDNFYNWFFLGNNQVGYIIEKLLLERFRIALNNNKERKYKIKKIINLCFNLEQNLNMEDYKGDKMELKERLKTNLETKEDWKIQDDKEFAFNLGQLLYYLNTKVKGKDRNTFEFLRSYFQIDVKDLEMVINKISRSFMNKCYETLSNKSKTVLASLMAYLEEKKFTELKYNLLLLGATTNCQLFANTEEEKNTDNEEEKLNGTDDIDEDLEEVKKEKKEKKSKK